MSTISYVTLNDHTDYEIQEEYPFRIRRIGSDKNITVGVDGKGYSRVYLNGNSHLLHRVIAEQFLPNPDELTCVDHINHDRTDYHLDNLRWVSNSENNFNKSSHRGVTYEILEYDQVDTAYMVPVESYGDHEINNVFYEIHKNRFLFNTGVNMRVMTVNYNKSDSAFVCAKSTQGNQVAILFTVFREKYKKAIQRVLLNLPA